MFHDLIDICLTLLNRPFVHSSYCLQALGPEQALPYRSSGLLAIEESMFPVSLIALFVYYSRSKISAVLKFADGWVIMSFKTGSRIVSTTLNSAGCKFSCTRIDMIGYFGQTAITLQFTNIEMSFS